LETSFGKWNILLLLALAMMSQRKRKGNPAEKELQYFAENCSILQKNVVILHLL
jgi:hypothetical protein